MRCDNLPFMLPSTAVDAAWAAQPDLLIAALVRKVGWLLAFVEVWVPIGLDEVVIRVGQCLLALGVEAWACIALAAEIWQALCPVKSRPKQNSEGDVPTHVPSAGDSVAKEKARRSAESPIVH